MCLFVCLSTTILALQAIASLGSRPPPFRAHLNYAHAYAENIRRTGKAWADHRFSFSTIDYKSLTYARGGSRPITVFRPDKNSFSSQSENRQPLILR